MLRFRRHSTTVIAGIALVILAGCATASPPGALESPGPTPPATSGPAGPAEPGGDTETGVSPADGAPAPGAYVDYREGIIADTAGTKVLFFHAPWCPQCRSLEASIEAGDIPDGVTIIKADFDSELGLRQEYGVTLQTTVVYVGDDGELLSRTVLSRDASLDALLAAAP